DVAANRALEAGPLGGDGVVAGEQEGRLVVPLLVGGGVNDNAGVEILDLDRRAGDGGAGRVGDAAVDGAAVFLGVKSETEKQSGENSHVVFPPDGPTVPFRFRGRKEF